MAIFIILVVVTMMMIVVVTMMMIVVVTMMLIVVVMVMMIVMVMVMRMMFPDLAIAQAHIIWEYGVSSEKGETTWILTRTGKCHKNADIATLSILSYLIKIAVVQTSYIIYLILSLPPGGIDVAMINQEAVVVEVVSSYKR